MARASTRSAAAWAPTTCTAPAAATSSPARPTATPSRAATARTGSTATRATTPSRARPTATRCTAARAGQLYGNAGGDYLVGDGGLDRLYGGEGTDTLKGDGGSDELRGGPNNDTLLSGGGGDYYGEGDIDTVDYSAWNRAVRVSLDNSANDRSLPTCSRPIGCPVVLYHNVHDDVENVIGTSRNDEIKGSGYANDLRGRGGNDTIRGEAGNDYLDGEDGTSQKLYGGVGSDTCRGSGTITYDSCELR